MGGLAIMVWKKADFLFTFVSSFLVYLLLHYLYLIGNLPAFVYQLDTEQRNFYFAALSTLLVLFQNVIDVIWSSADYRMMVARELKVRRIFKTPPKIKLKYGPKTEGHIYFVRLQNTNIYKVGMSIRLNERLLTLIKEYGLMDIIALWNVPDLKVNEDHALAMTKKYFFVDGKRKELRRMTPEQANDFMLEFTEYLSEQYSVVRYSNG
jgi:hypothetical protein